MKQNIGKVDQTVRYVVAVILIVAAILFDLWWLIIPGVILGFTAAISWCGLYRILGFDTCRFNPKQ